MGTAIPLAGLLSCGISRVGLVRWTIRLVAAASLSCILGITILLGLLLFDHNRDTTLPAPSGSLAVGRTTCVWSDAPAEPVAQDPGSKRELLAWIWYPAVRQPDPTAEDYLPTPWRKALEGQSGPVLTQFVTRDLARVQVHSIRNAEISPVQPCYPVVLMRTGGASLTTDYTTLAEDLASHGYVVVGFDAPFRSWLAVLSDGRVIPRAPENNLDLVSGPEVEQLASKLVGKWSADCRFALDQLQQLNDSDPSGRFKQRLDLQRVGVFGHSLGGATALQLCHDDRRCKAGVDVDGLPLGSVVAEGVTQPFMFLLGDHSSEPEAESGRVLAKIHSIHDRLPEDRRTLITIRGANHFLFSDGAMLKSPLAMSALRTVGVVRIDGLRQASLTARCISTFFDVHLKGSPASELKSLSEYPEIQLED
jgi:predicted dienelactone hydrolase